MSTQTSDNNKRIAKNSAILYLRTIITMIIGFVSSRVILANLGIQDYGIYNVVGGITSLFIFLNSTMNVSTSRFLTFELGTGDIEKLKTIYSQAKLIHYIIAVIVLILIESVGIWLIYNKLSIPTNRINATFWILHTTTLGTILSIISTPDSALVVSHERMGFFAYVSLADSILRLAAAFAISFIASDRLIWYAILMLIVFGIDRICYWIYCKVNFKESTGKLVYSKMLFRQMLNFAGWNILGNLANMTREQGLTILINIFTNPAVNAARAVTTQISNSISTFAFNVRTAVNPQITKSYAEGNYEYMHKLIIFSSISCYYILLIIFVPLFFFADTLFKIWLVEVPKYTVEFFRLSLIGSLINSFANPLIIGIHATGNIRKFQIFEGIMLMTTLPISLVFLYLGYSPTCTYIAIVISNILVLFSDVTIILPAIRFDRKLYFKAVLLKALKIMLLAITIPCLIIFINKIYEIPFYTYILTAVSAVSTMAIVYFRGLNSNERMLLKTQIKSKIKR